MKLLFFGFVGGVVGVYFSLSLAGNYFGNLLTSATEASPSPLPVANSSATEAWQKIIAESSQKTVAIQVFQYNKLVKQGTGVMVSSDGLIVTVSDLAVSGAVYQIYYEDKIIKGYPASVDYRRNLMVLKSDGNISNVADLRQIEFTGGQEIAIVGRIVSLSKPVVFSQLGLVSYITDRNTVIDATYGSDVIGTVSVDSKGNMIGINFLRSGKINLISTGTISDFLNNYLEKGNGN